MKSDPLAHVRELEAELAAERAEIERLRERIAGDVLYVPPAFDASTLPAGHPEALGSTPRFGERYLDSPMPQRKRELRAELEDARQDRDEELARALTAEERVRTLEGVLAEIRRHLGAIYGDRELPEAVRLHLDDARKIRDQRIEALESRCGWLEAEGDRLSVELGRANSMIGEAQRDRDRELTRNADLEAQLETARSLAASVVEAGEATVTRLEAELDSATRRANLHAVEKKAALEAGEAAVGRLEAELERARNEPIDPVRDSLDPANPDVKALELDRDGWRSRATALEAQLRNEEHVGEQLDLRIAARDAELEQLRPLVIDRDAWRNRAETLEERLGKMPLVQPSDALRDALERCGLPTRGFRPSWHPTHANRLLLEHEATDGPARS